MEGKWSDRWLLAAPSQMAAGTALRLADNQRTSKLRRALKLISVQSQEAKGTDQRKKAAIGRDWDSQKSQQAWKWAALARSFFSACFFCAIFALRFSFTYIRSPLVICSFNLLSFSLCLYMLHDSHYSITVKTVVMAHLNASWKIGIKCDGHCYG